MSEFKIGTALEVAFERYSLTAAALRTAEKLLERTEASVSRLERETDDLKFKRDNYAAAACVRRESVGLLIKEYDKAFATYDEMNTEAIRKSKESK